MKLTFLGTGTSSGVPVIGCSCKVCLSSDPKDTRLRCSALLEIGDQVILIDAGPDVRIQLLHHRIQRIDSILITHSHFDHVIGLDELRPFSWHYPMPLYSDIPSFKDIKRVFEYLFNNTNIQIGGGLTQFIPHTIEHYQEFSIEKTQILPLLVMHGRLPITGYKIGELAYLTDVKTLPQKTIDSVKGVHTLVLDCLRLKKHSTHINLEEALALIEQIQPQNTYFIHMNHELSHQEWTDLLPPNVHVAYDNQQLNIPYL